MFRAKITLTFVILTALLLGGVYLIMNGGVEDAFEQDAEIALRRAATIEEQSLRLDEFGLIEKAEFTANNAELYRYMQLSGDSELYTELAAKHAEGSNVTEVRHLAVYDELLAADRIRLQDKRKSVEGERNLDLSLYARRPTMPDMFAILDSKGEAVAALGQGNYSWFGPNVENLAEDYPVILNAVDENQVKTGVWEFAWREGDDVNLYRVAVVPIRPDRNMAPAGVVVTGNIISDGLAKRSQRLMAGVTSQGDDIETVDTKDLEAAPQVAFFHGKKFSGSTFSADQENALSKAIFEEQKVLQADQPERLLEVSLDGTPYLAMVRFLSGEFQDKDDPTGYVVLTSLEDANKPVAAAMQTIWLLGGGVLLLGLILLLFFIQKFVKPAEEIEKGIGEVLAGNKDYTFDLNEPHPIFSSIAQGLNLMSAYLQGKPMPDDVDDMGGWGELVGDPSAGSSGSGGGKSKVQGVMMPGMGGSKTKTDDDTDGSS